MKACKCKIYKPLFFGGLISFFLLLLQMTGCAEVPITHRRGLHLVPESELLTMSFQQ